MNKYIDAEKLKAEINKLRSETCISESDEYYECAKSEVSEIITSLQQGQPEVDLEKLGGIARHLIAVKDHEEDLRLDESEWLLLERIGYHERFNARKEE